MTSVKVPPRSIQKSHVLVVTSLAPFAGRSAWSPQEKPTFEPKPSDRMLISVSVCDATEAACRHSPAEPPGRPGAVLKETYHEEACSCLGFRARPARRRGVQRQRRQNHDEQHDTARGQAGHASCRFAGRAGASGPACATGDASCVSAGPGQLILRDRRLAGGRKQFRPPLRHTVRPRRWARPWGQALVPTQLRLNWPM